MKGSDTKAFEFSLFFSFLVIRSGNRRFRQLLLVEDKVNVLFEVPHLPNWPQVVIMVYTYTM